MEILELMFFLGVELVVVGSEMVNFEDFTESLELMSLLGVK